MTQAIRLRQKGKLTTANLDSLVSKFLQSLDIKQSSKETYKRNLMPYIKWVVSEGMQNPTREDIIAFKAHLVEQGLSSLTIANYLVVVRKFYEWAESMRYCHNIAKGVKGAKRAKGFKKDPLTVNQIKSLLGHIERGTEQGKRDYAILNLLIRTGLRTIEVVRSNVGDIRQASGEIILWVQGKGRDTKDEFVVLTESVLYPIYEYLETRGKAGENEPLFTSISDRNKGKRMTTRSISRIAKEHLKDVGIISNRLTAHSLRHTAITLSLQGGATIQEAQALGRHSNVNTTLIYAHNVNRIANAAERKIDAVLTGLD